MRRAIIGLTIAATMISVANAQQLQLRPSAGWFSNGNGCRVWDPSAKPNETFTWSGPCPNGTASGDGVLQWFEDKKPSDRYEGHLNNGRAEGHGVLEWPGGRYDGQWDNFRPHGQGTYRNAKGEVFSGNWVLGCFHDGNRRAAIGVNPATCP